MGLFFWRKTRDTGLYRSDGIAQTLDVPAAEDNPLPVRIYPDDFDDPLRVQLDQAYLPSVSGENITRRVLVPGIGTGSAYAAGDAFGTIITIPDVFRPGKNSGVVTKLVFHDLDDEGLTKDVIFYRQAISTTADNSAYTPTDIENLDSEGAETISTYFNWAVNQIGQWTGTHWVRSLDTNLYIRLVTQGADNIAAGSEPRLDVTVVPD